MQKHSTAFALDFIVEFFHIVSKTQKQYFNMNFNFATQQKPPERHILFQNAKRALNLNRTVEPEIYPLISRYWWYEVSNPRKS